MKILLLDVETAPNTAYVWGLWDQTISHEHVIESGHILCWAAKWFHEKTISFMSLQQSTPLAMLSGIHVLLDEAEIVVTYNGQTFDLPTLNKEFIKYGFAPPSPYKQIDLYREVKRSFRFESNKLDAVTKNLGLGRKTKHQGFELWVGCMHNDAKCWRVMETYNRQDVALLQTLYLRLRPWLPTHPHVGLLSDKSQACPHCGVSGKMQSRGKAVARSKVYQRFQCQACSAWCRARLSEKTNPLYI